MKTRISIVACIVAAACVCAWTLSAAAADQGDKEVKSIYEFTKDDIKGKPVKLEKYKGKVLLIVNVASKCGFTPQYKDLEALYEKYKDKGLVVMGFPANNFGGQEPGTNAEILEFCTSTFDVSFPMFSKVSVKGDDIDSLFAYLTKDENPDFTGEIKWNFEKFLIGKDGELLHRFRSKSAPMDEAVVKAVEEALKS
ncbi:MAG: redoxin domain-containing protein [bacterium]|nr:redoxin domain-containing protein [bacterium]